METQFADLYLAKSSPKSQYYSMKFYSEVVYPSMQYLPEAVGSKDGVEVLFKYMNENWSLHRTKVLSAFDLSGFESIYDIGGSSGALSKELIAVYPNCTVTLFDLPEVVETSKKYHAFSEASWITFHEGDFLKDPIPEADLYILARILFDWSDEKCLQLLIKVFKVCKPGGGVLIVEPILDEDKTASFSVVVYSILLLLHAKGKVRTLSEHRSLLSTAGFKDIQLKKGNTFDVILARK